jgi:hypothetical protein
MAPFGRRAMFWIVAFYVLVLIVTSTLGFWTGAWRHFQTAAVGGLVLITVWWIILKARGIRDP